MSATEATRRGDGGTALESVRGLEETLDNRRAAEEAAEARVSAARREAERIVREAREGALREAEERRRAALAHADAEAERVLAEAREKAEALLDLAEKDRAAAAREVIGLILPGRGG